MELSLEFPLSLHPLCQRSAEWQTIPLSVDQWLISINQFPLQTVLWEIDRHSALGAWHCTSFCSPLFILMLWNFDRCTQLLRLGLKVNHAKVNLVSENVSHKRQEKSLEIVAQLFLFVYFFYKIMKDNSISVSKTLLPTFSQEYILWLTWLFCFYFIMNCQNMKRLKLALNGYFIIHHFLLWFSSLFKSFHTLKQKRFYKLTLLMSSRMFSCFRWFE